MTKIEEDFPFFSYLREKCEKRSANKLERLRASQVPNENDGQENANALIKSFFTQAYNLAYNLSYIYNLTFLIHKT